MLLRGGSHMGIKGSWWKHLVQLPAHFQVRSDSIASNLHLILNLLVYVIPSSCISSITSQPLLPPSQGARHKKQCATAFLHLSEP